MSAATNPRTTLGDELDRWADEGGRFDPEASRVAALERLAPAS